MTLPTYQQNIRDCHAAIQKLEGMLPNADVHQATIIREMIAVNQGFIAAYTSLAKPIRNAEAYDRLFPHGTSR